MVRGDDGRRQRGFTLIELLIVVAIIGIIAAIAIPGLYSAIQKARQKRTMSDMKTLATAISIYAMDNNAYIRVGSTNAGDLQPFLQDLIPVIPANDSWNFPVRYETDALGSAYTIISFGSNRQADLPYIYGVTRRFQDDIVYSVGVFVQWPDGIQE